MNARIVWIAVLGLSLIGCASPPKDAGFSDVKQLAARHTGHDIQWNQNSADDQAVEAVIQSLLGHELTLDQAVQIALLNNRDLQAEYEDLGIAQADVVQAGLLRNPVFDASARFPDGGGLTNLEFSVSQNFLDLLMIPLRKKVAQANFDAAKFKVSQHVIDLADRTQSAFYMLQADDQIADLRRTALDASTASFDASKRIHDAGNMTALNFAQEQTQFEQAKLDLAEAESNSASAREHLTVLMGLTGAEPHWSIAKNLPDLPKDKISSDGLEQFALAQRLDLAAAKQNEIIATRSLRAATPLALISDSTVGIDTEHEPEGEWVTGPQVSLPIPLFDQGQATTAKFRAQLRQSRDRYRALAIQIQSEVRDISQQMQSAYHRADSYRTDIIPLHHLIVEQTQLEYNGMIVGVFQLLQARQDEIDANQKYIESLRDYWLARTALQSALGGTFPKDQGESK